MTGIQKERIDRMSYEEMLRIWRFAPFGNPMFQGKAGDYFTKNDIVNNPITESK